MGVITKIKGTIENSFGINGGSGGFSYLLSRTGGTPSIRNAGDTDYEPLRVKDDPADTDSAMTRGAIASLVGGTDSIKWIQVPFAVGSGTPAGPNNYDYVSTATIPNNSIILDARVLLSTVYDVGSNAIQIGYTSAGSNDLFNSGDLDINSSATAGDVTTQQYVEQVPGAGPYNVHIRVQEDGGTPPTAGDGIVLVGYVETPLS